MKERFGQKIVKSTSGKTELVLDWSLSPSSFELWASCGFHLWDRFWQLEIFSIEVGPLHVGMWVTGDR